jgi:hypothetical protein
VSSPPQQVDSEYNSLGWIEDEFLTKQSHYVLYYLYDLDLAP